ncbi:hypothetical protein AKJ09_00831 [Labilithrix luteola]|uniref:Porin n=1 Tax=Labilithrix luteola TaxID=1391654 RepID=A0A0K1PKW9_9BACT|nr:hypothetical protein [Labilithrix luteola]AKU94167.1 hypothetical protein AKJ09_00831 [Labilithrix luteola]
MTAGILGASTFVLAPTMARADEPVAARAPRLMSETGENTTVIDAFDKDDPFDLNLLLTLRQAWKHAKIRRETALNQPGLSDGGFVSSRENVANYAQSVTTLEVGTDIGIFRDLALSFRAPIILADSRELTDLDGSSNNPQRLQDPSGDALFSLPFKSPTRSGIDWISVALNYAIMNQQRDPAKPTWVVGVETRIGVGSRLHACNDNAAVKCPDPANPTVGRDAGISRGMTDYIVQTTLSKRMGYVEPYGGLKVLFEVPQSNSDFGKTSDLRGTLLNRPPVVGTVTAGMEVIPWERREAFQRFALDFKAIGSYHSPGRDYSELFDALGSSQARSLRSPNPGAYRAGPDGFTSVPDPNAAPVYFNGITDQQAFSSFSGRFGLTMQAGEYVKFTAGVGLTWIQNHLITAADACNPDVTGDIGTSGPCRTGAQSAAGGSATGTPNPNHRPVIDLPGRRFSVDDTTIVDLWLSGVVMF